MTSLVVSNITDGSQSTTTSKFSDRKAHAWCSFSKMDVVIIKSHGLSSMVDGGTGIAYMVLTYNISQATSAASGLSHAIYSPSTEFGAIQNCSYIETTSYALCECGSNNSTLNDWQLGYFYLNGK